MPSDPLNSQQVEPLLAQLEGWRVEEGKTLVKTFKFKNFVQAVGFVDAITPIAEAEGHHPDLCLSWGKVEASLSTHSVGGLTTKDFSLAVKLDRAYSQLAQPA